MKTLILEDDSYVLVTVEEPMASAMWRARTGAETAAERAAIYSGEGAPFASDESELEREGRFEALSRSAMVRATLKILSKARADMLSLVMRSLSFLRPAELGQANFWSCWPYVDFCVSPSECRN